MNILRNASFKPIEASYKGQHYTIGSNWYDTIREALVEYNRKEIGKYIQELEVLIPGYEPEDDIKKILDE